MEVSLESFSIREYTARMRRVDASKCWPFDGEVRESQLPPIECRRYRWWSSELQIARSGEACERRAGAPEGPACGGVHHSCAGASPVIRDEEEVFGGDQRRRSTTDAIEDEDGGEEEEGRLARSPGKAKTRAPKKRSILELFAVAPQIDAAVEVEADQGDDDGEALAVGKDSSKEEYPKQDAMEEPRKRKEESVETLMRKKIKRNNICAKKKDYTEDKRKKKKTKMMMIRKKRQKLLKKPRKQKNTIEIGVAKKEKICKRRLQSPIDFAQLLHDSIIVKRRGKEGLPVLAQRRKPARSKRALKADNVKAVQVSKLKKQLSESKCLPIHSILRNRKKVASTGLGKVHITDGSQNDHGNCIQQSDKHVRFSGKDDILGNHERRFCPLGSPQMQSLCKVFSDVLAASVMDKPSEGCSLAECSSKILVATANEDTASDCADTRKAGEPSPQQQLTDIQGVTNADMSAEPQGNHVQKKTTLDDLVDLNNSVQDHYDMDQIDHCPTEQLLNNINSKQTERCNHHQILEDPLKVTEIDTDRNLSSGPAAVITITDVVRNSNSGLGTCSLLKDVMVNKSSTYDSQFQSSHLLKRGMMSTVCSAESTQIDHIPESRLESNPEELFHGKGTSRNVFGLPLNSQGGYIHLQSTAQSGINQLFKNQNMMLGPVSSFLVHSTPDPSSIIHTNEKGKVPLSSVYVKNQQKWIPEEFAPLSSVYAENQQKWIPENGFSRDQSMLMPVSGFAELQDIIQIGEKESLRKYDACVSNLNVEANLYRLPCHALRGQNQSYTHHDRCMTELEGASELHFHSTNQPTMRLMGKDFIVCRQENNKENQGSTGSKIWADKKMLDDLHPANRMCEGTAPKHRSGPDWAAHHPSGTSYANVIHTLETQNKPTVSSFYHLTGDPQSHNARLDYGLGVASGNSCHSVSYGHGYKLDTFNHPHAHEAWAGKAPMNKKNHGCESEYLKMGLNHGCESEYLKMDFRSPLALCNPDNVCQHLLLNSTHCKATQSLSHSMTSTFSPSSSFEDPGNMNYIQLSSAQGSSQRLPHWLVSTGQKRNTSSSPLCFPDPVSKHEPYMKSGTSILPLPSTHITSIQPFPSLGQSSHLCFSDLPSPASLVHSSLYPPFPAAKSGSTDGTCCWTMCRNRDCMKSKYSFLNSSDYTSKMRKRPATCGNDLLMAMKRTNLCIQGDSGSSMGSKIGEETHACVEHISKMLELSSGGKNMASDVAKDAHAHGTSKLDSGSRTRPVKLSAGAKHILKPSLNMDLDNCVPIHSTIPFSRATTAKVSASQKKPTKIYQF